MQPTGPDRRVEEEPAQEPAQVTSAVPVSQSRLAEGTGPVAEHRVLVSAALVEEEAALHRALQLRELPPARFRPPIPLPARAEVYTPPPPPRRLGLGLFAAALALTSVAIAGWNTYWLAAPLGEAVAALFG